MTAGTHRQAGGSLSTGASGCRTHQRRMKPHTYTTPQHSCLSTHTAARTADAGTDRKPAVGWDLSRSSNKRRQRDGIGCTGIGVAAGARAAHERVAFKLLHCAGVRRVRREGGYERGDKAGGGSESNEAMDVREREGESRYPDACGREHP
jgi:hypothetical protein